MADLIQQILSKDLSALRAALSKADITVDVNSGVILPPTAKFKTPYTFARLTPDPALRVEYLKQRWGWFNEHLYGSSMKLPEFTLDRSAKAPKTLGWWRPWGRKMGFSGKLFQIPNDKQLLGTLVHEMAHQYVSEVARPQVVEDAHGPTWKSVMQQVGMPDDDKFYGDVQDLYDKKQLQDSNDLKKSQQTDSTKIQDLVNAPFSYAEYISVRKGKRIPVIVIGGFRKGTTVPCVAEHMVMTEEFVWHDPLNLVRKDPVQARVSFPRILFTPSAKSKVEVVRRFLENHRPDLKV